MACCEFTSTLNVLSAITIIPNATPGSYWSLGGSFGEGGNSQNLSKRSDCIAFEFDSFERLPISFGIECFYALKLGYKAEICWELFISRKE